MSSFYHREQRYHIISHILITLFVSFLWTALWLSMGNFPAWAASGDVLSNSKAEVDISQVSEGSVKVRYTGGKQVKIKVQITEGSGTTYTYNLNSSGAWETLPLTEGDGAYTVKVLENIAGTRYALAYSCPIDVKLTNSFAPFLHPNQYVNYTDDSKVVKLAAELTVKDTNDLDKISTIFNYVVDTIDYDEQQAITAQSGYIPDLDHVLGKETGICLDYAGVMTAMLRSQNIPCKLVVGYAKTTYHAWINVFITGKGWVVKVIYFDGKTWTLMDPTLVSSGSRSKAAMDFVTTADNYTKKYVY